jgi:Pyridoxamine 5'-phosphate oxidase
VADPISPELAEFLQSGISILVGTRDARLMPEVARVLGARVEPGGRELTIYVPAATGERTLANARENGRLAVCFAAVDHTSYQLKGRLAEVRPARAAERRTIERYRAALAQHFGSVGLPPRLTHRLSHWPAHALRMAVEAVFLQTPGPGAGVPLVPPRGGRP